MMILVKSNTEIRTSSFVRQASSCWSFSLSQSKFFLGCQRMFVWFLKTVKVYLNNQVVTQMVFTFCELGNLRKITLWLSHALSRSHKQPPPLSTSHVILSKPEKAGSYNSTTQKILKAFCKLNKQDIYRRGHKTLRFFSGAYIFIINE